MVEVGNQRGVLATVASAISDNGSNIDNVSVEERDGMSSTLKFVITVADDTELAKMFTHLRGLPAVMDITRGGLVVPPGQS